MGLPAIHALGASGSVTGGDVEAWENSTEFLFDLVHARQPETLLYREQHDIIDHFYVGMLKRSPPAARIFTYALLAGTPAVPDAKGYQTLFSVHAGAAPISAPFARLVLRTPLAAGISHSHESAGA